MPIYVFEDEATGKRTEVVRPVDRRDDPLVVDGRALRRRTAPESLAVLGHTAHPHLGRTFEERIQRGYHALEQTHGSSTGCEFNQKNVKKIWNQPPPPSRNSQP